MAHGGGEVEEWRRRRRRGKESVCPEVDKRIWGGGGLLKMLEKKSLKLNFIPAHLIPQGE